MRQGTRRRKKDRLCKSPIFGKLGKIDNGIVAVTAWGLIDGITIPLIFEVFKPKERLKAEDTYCSKPEIAAQMVREIKQIGFEIELVLADSLYGESESKFWDV
jgi:SRSO17 transposase